ncbi:hypothetical protein D7Z26_23530 [Cohnella endophytica]|uniref:Uncharacterized protein n=1 Tax=Cohnella endophytica TaxID=2419778 RepID=A0A494XFJ5_9BACL|nr:DUF5693 family protein [Cohnella endophytica]RKP47276.1 hypothetical protein D7Z26_23530 [Cohnella endophytica]
MPQWLNRWNARFAKWLWWVVLVGVVAALPVMYARVQTETSADKVAIGMDYRDLLQVGNTQADPQGFVQEQLKLLKASGVNSMTVFESTLEELAWAGEINVYNTLQAGLLEGQVSPPTDNGTYLLFNRPEHIQTLRPIIEWAFNQHGAKVTEWTVKGQAGLRINMGYDDASIRPMQPNPLAMQMLHDAGFNIVPRLSDRFERFDPKEMDKWLQSFQDLGVKQVAFDGDAVTGYGKGDKISIANLHTFASELKKHKIGVAIFENLKVPQKGMATLANLLDYNAIRAHSVGAAEMTVIKQPVLEDRLVLAVKDRDVRLLYLRAAAVKDVVKGQVTHPMQMIEDVLQGDEDSVGVVQQLKDFGFEVGVPQAFDVHKAPQELLLRGITMIGAMVLIALTFGLFVPGLLLPALLIGGIGGAGLYVLSPTLMVQALALLAAISAPTASVILLVKRLRVLRENGAGQPISGVRRLGGAILLLVRTTLLSLAGIPFIVALLNHISYSLVLQQFRGVALLHLAPIALVALYVFLYGTGTTVYGNAKRILSMPLTVLWIVAIGILGAAGMYYLTRTGNAGQVSGIEMKFRSILENTFGVRPRTKEFLLGHPLFFAGIFLALRYRWAMVLIIAGTIGQLSLVDTFAHIHTPLMLSIIRILLGLGIGIVLGLVIIAVWQVAEKYYFKYRNKLNRTV